MVQEIIHAGYRRTEGFRGKEIKIGHCITVFQKQTVCQQLAGFSAGGQFVQGFAFDHSDQVYAVSVLSAANYYEPTKDAAHIPFLVVIGGRDNPTAIGNAQVFSDLLAEKGYDHEFHILPNVSHQVSQTAKELTIEPGPQDS